MKGIPLGGLVLIAITASTNNFANEDSSMYMGVSSVFSSYKGNLIDTSFAFEPDQYIDDDTTMFEFYVGYQPNTYISFEIGYADFGEVSKTLTYNPDAVFISLPQNIVTREIKHYSLRSLIEYPLKRDFSVVGLVGYSYFDIEQTRTGGSLLNTDFTENFYENELFYGLGGKYSFNKKYTGKLIFTKSETDDFDLSMIYLAVERTFGLN